MTEAEVGVIQFEDRWRSHKPRNTGEKEEKMKSFLRVLEGMNPATGLSLAHWNWFWTSGPRNIRE